MIMCPNWDDFDLSALREAIRLSRYAPVSRTAFSVGCTIMNSNRSLMATGFSREWGSHSHAEAVAIEKAQHARVGLSDCTLYSSLEPCSVRKSGRESCCDLISRAGIRRVVFGMREPPIFVDGRGAEVLFELGIEVIEVNGMDGEVREINAHLLGAATAFKRPTEEDQSA